MKRIFSNFTTRIFLIAFVLRLIPVLLSFNLGIGLDDMFQYDMLARSMVAGNGYRWYSVGDLYLIEPVIALDLTSVDYDPRGVLTSFRPPLYPTLLALIYLLTGTGAHRFFIVRLVQAFIGAFLAPLTFLLARKMLAIPPTVLVELNGKKERASHIAAWVVAVYPMLVIYPLSLATENLFFLLVLVSMLALLKAEESFSSIGGLSTKLVHRKNDNYSRGSFLSDIKYHIITARWFLLSGFLLGLTALTRSVALAFAGLAVLWVWFTLRNKKMALVTFFAVAFTVLPWMVRNTLLYQRPTGIETALGYDLYVSYHPQSSGTFQYPQSIDLLTIVDDMQREKIGLEKARQFILADPGRVPYLMARRFGYFFGLERRALTYFYSNNFFGYIPAPGLIIIGVIMLLPFVIVTTSAVLGLGLINWRPATWLLILLFIGYITPHILIIAEDRFHLTLVPFFAILAAFFWTEGLPGLKFRLHTHKGRFAISLACLAFLLLMLGWGLELWRDADMLIKLFGPHGNTLRLPY
jgi:hypothetical protein